MFDDCMRKQKNRQLYQVRKEIEKERQAKKNVWIPACFKDTRVLSDTDVDSPRTSQSKSIPHSCLTTSSNPHPDAMDVDVMSALPFHNQDKDDLEVELAWWTVEFEAYKKANPHLKKLVRDEIESAGETGGTEGSPNQKKKSKPKAAGKEREVTSSA